MTRKGKVLFIVIALIFILFFLYINRFKLCTTKNLGDILKLNVQDVKKLTYMRPEKYDASGLHYNTYNIINDEEIDEFLSELNSQKVIKIKYFIPNSDRAKPFYIALKDENNHDIYTIWEDDFCLFISPKGVEKNGDNYVIPELYYKKNERNFIENYFKTKGEHTGDSDGSVR